MNRLAETHAGMRPCPPDEVLRLLSRDELDSATFAELEEHIRGCRKCQARLEPLAWECPTGGTTGLCLRPLGADRPRIPGFQIERELGRGATGVVYLAWDETVGRQVALKVMQAAPGADHPARKRWRKEAKAFSSVRHPNVVALYSIGEEQSWLFLVLEYIRGRTLKDRLENPLPERQAAQLMETVANAVEHIHHQGILHLDLKPSNILLDAEPAASLAEATPKVADFGIAQILAHSDLTATGATSDGLGIGTPSYMSPEQVVGTPDQLCPATDVHARGAILYHLVAGCPPYQGPTPLDTLNQLRTREPVPPRQLMPSLSRDLDTIILKCLQKDSSQRYISARGLAEDLRRWIDGQPILARPVSAVERGWRWCRRRPVVATLVAALAVTILASGGGLYVLYRRADRQRANAESARQVAQQNLDIAMSAITPLQQFVLEALLDESFVGSDRLDETARMVMGQTARIEETAELAREQIARMRKLVGPKRQLLFALSRIDFRLATRLVAAGRSDEARGLVGEGLDVLRECQRQDPENEAFRWVTAEALLLACQLERNARRPMEALRYLDGATAFILQIKVDNRGLREQLCALSVADECRELAEVLTRLGNLAESARAMGSRRKILARLDSALSDQPDQVTIKACVLADQGEWDCAEGFVRDLYARRASLNGEPIAVREAIGCGLEEWLARRMRHWQARFPGQETTARSLEEQSDAILSFLAAMYGALDVGFSRRQWATTRIVGRLASLATAQRHSREFGEADATAAFLMAFSYRLVARFPDDPHSYVALAGSYVQESKKGWRRKDLAAIRESLAKVVEALNRARSLDPNDDTIRRLLLDWTKRMAGLPKSL